MTTLSQEKAINSIEFIGQSSNPLGNWIANQSVPFADFAETDLVENHIQAVIEHLMAFWTTNWSTSEYVNQFDWCPQMFADAASRIYADHYPDIHQSHFKKGSPSAIGFIMAVQNALMNIFAPIILQEMDRQDFTDVLKAVAQSETLTVEVEKQFNETLADMGYQNAITD